MPFSDSTSVGLERALWVDAGSPPRRRHAEENPRCHRDDQRERQNSTVHAEIEEHGIAGAGEQPHQECRPPPRERNADERAQAGKQHTLRQELPNDPPASRADRQPDRYLSRADSGASQQEVGHVRARNEQNDGDGAP